MVGIQLLSSLKQALYGHFSRFSNGQAVKGFYEVELKIIASRIVLVFLQIGVHLIDYATRTKTILFRLVLRQQIYEWLTCPKV